MYLSALNPIREISVKKIKVSMEITGTVISSVSFSVKRGSKIKMRFFRLTGERDQASRNRITPHIRVIRKRNFLL